MPHYQGMAHLILLTAMRGGVILLSGQNALLLLWTLLLVNPLLAGVHSHKDGGGLYLHARTSKELYLTAQLVVGAFPQQERHRITFVAESIEGDLCLLVRVAFEQSSPCSGVCGLIQSLANHDEPLVLELVAPGKVLDLWVKVGKEATELRRAVLPDGRAIQFDKGFWGIFADRCSDRVDPDVPCTLDEARILVNCDQGKDSLVGSVAHEAVHAFCAQVGMDLEHSRDDELFASAEALAKQNFQTGSPMDIVSLQSFKIWDERELIFGDTLRPVVRLKKARRRVDRRRPWRPQPWFFIPQYFPGRSSWGCNTLD